MALSTQRASSSLALAESPPRWEFDVFLSFRGEDTRWGFISHLYHQLQFWQVFKTFMDDRELPIGADISPGLLSAIAQSHLAIVVLSPNYASSTWCLDELEKIIESMGAGDERILPVFYNVDPSDVRHQRQSFAHAFAKHEEKFSDQKEKVERWRAALSKVANFSGWDATNYRSERELIEVIVERVWEKVRPTVTLSYYTENLVGINFTLSKMGLLLAPEEKDVRCIGIWGMGGVGKTTFARLVFERISHNFEVAEFLVDGTTVNLQKQVLSSILKENVSQFWDEYKGTYFIRKCLSKKKVLLVVDDVDRCDYLQTLAKNKSWFGKGSRIIATTRDERVLIENDIEISFQLAGLSDSKALELFSQNAFKTDQPKKGFLELSKCVVDYAEGLPLALKVLGGFLYKRELQEWLSALESLKRIPNQTIFQKLKLSYDVLNDLEKNILLDVAFFHKGVEKGRLLEMLKCYGFNVFIVIKVLIQKSLLTIDLHNNVGMHGLVQEMAWEIVRQESLEEPGLRSRLYHRNDIFHVFMTNSETEAIRGIRLCLPQLEEADSSWNCECFSKMSKLKFLEFDNFIISSGPKFLPNSLIILRWKYYPSKSLPANFRPNMLAELRMQKSNLVRLWDGRQDLPNLKYMNLRGSKKLRKTPDFTCIPNLEELYLDGCEGLVEVHPSIAFNKKLKKLTLGECKNLNSFPNKIEMDSLEYLSLRWCLKVKCPEFREGMKSLTTLELGRTASTLSEVLSSIRHLVGLHILHLDDCTSVGSPRRQICGGGSSSKMGFIRALFGRKSPQRLCLAVPSPWALPSLTSLILSNCNLGQGVIPDDIGYCFPSLIWLYLCGNNFVSLPAGSIKCLTKLRYLNLSSCKRLEQLPDLPLNRDLRVHADDCDSLKKLSEPSQQGGCTSLREFELTTENCSGLVDDQGLNNGIFSMLRRLAAQGISSDFRSYGSFKIVSPGSKISEWFDIQSKGDSLIVELLPPDRESEWIGILFCVLFAPLEGRSIHVIFSSPKIDDLSTSHLKGDHLWLFFLPRSEIKDIMSDLMYFSLIDIQDTTSGRWYYSIDERFFSSFDERYFSFDEIPDTTSGHMYFAFDAYTENKVPCSNIVKRCGARMLYEQDLKDLFNKLKRSSEYCENEEGLSGSSIKESRLKRHKQ